MPVSLRGVRLVLLSAILCIGGCIFDTDDDLHDDDLVTATDEDAVVGEADTDVNVNITADIMQCRTRCDDTQRQCGVKCVDQTCVAGCETTRQQCYTSCD